jgi:hypothetical protein
MTVQQSSRLPRPIAPSALDDTHIYQTTHYNLNGMGCGYRVISPMLGIFDWASNWLALSFAYELHHDQHFQKR